MKPLRDGIVLGTPLIIIGSIFLVLGNLPFEGYPEMLAEAGISDWAIKMPAIISGAVLQVIALAVTVAIYYPFVRSIDKNQLRQESETATSEALVH